MPSSLSGPRASAHSVPTRASTTNATGSKQAGRFKESKNERGSSVGINTINQITMKIPTPDVDHGMQAATSTGYMSTDRSQNRECTAESITADIPGCGGILRTASDISY